MLSHHHPIIQNGMTSHHECNISSSHHPNAPCKCQIPQSHLPSTVLVRPPARQHGTWDPEARWCPVIHPGNTCREMDQSTNPFFENVWNPKLKNGFYHQGWTIQLFQYFVGYLLRFISGCDAFPWPGSLYSKDMIKDEISGIYSIDLYCNFKKQNTLK